MTGAERGGGERPPPPGEFTYAPAVDPWAGADPPPPSVGAPAPAPAPGTEPWLASTQVEPESPRRRRKLWWLVAAAAVVVVGVAATLVVVFWPGVRAVDFRALGDPRKLAPAVPIGTGLVRTQIVGDTAYLINQASEGGRLGVAAVGTDGDARWTAVIDGVTADTRWDDVAVTGGGLLAVTDPATDTRQRLFVALGTDGKERWRRTLTDEKYWVVGTTTIFIDGAGKRLTGVRIDGSGADAWTRPVESTPAIYPVTTPDDLAGPADAAGRSLRTRDDTRMVLIGPDRSAQVFTAATGEPVGDRRQSVGSTSDEIVAHNGRLFVWESGETHRIVAYDLAKMGEPTSLYTVPADNYVKALTPCGDDAVCWIESTSLRSETHQVAGIKATGGTPWRRPLPGADTLVPVGDHVLATQPSPATVSLYNAADQGKPRWAQLPGAAVRLDAGNLLLFSRDLSTSPGDPALTGAPVDGARVPVGSLAGVRSASCSWNSSTLICAGDQDYQLQTFA